MTSTSLLALQYKMQTLGKVPNSAARSFRHRRAATTLNRSLRRFTVRSASSVPERSHNLSIWQERVEEGIAEAASDLYHRRENRSGAAMLMSSEQGGALVAGDELVERWSLLESTLQEFFDSGSGVKFQRSECGHFVRLNLKPFLDTTAYVPTNSDGGTDGRTPLASEFKLWEDMTEIYRVVLWPCGIMSGEQDNAGTFSIFVAGEDEDMLILLLDRLERLLEAKKLLHGHW